MLTNYSKLPVILDGLIGENLDTILVLYHLIKCKDINLKMVTTSNENQSHDLVRIINHLFYLTETKGIIIGKGTCKHNDKKTYSNYISNKSQLVNLDSCLLISKFVEQSQCNSVIISMGCNENIHKLVNSNFNKLDKVHLVCIVDNSNYFESDNLSNLLTKNWASIEIIPINDSKKLIDINQEINIDSNQADIWKTILSYLIHESQEIEIPYLITMNLLTDNLNLDDVNRLGYDKQFQANFLDRIINS